MGAGWWGWYAGWYSAFDVGRRVNGAGDAYRTTGRRFRLGLRVQF